MPRSILRIHPLALLIPLLLLTSRCQATPQEEVVMSLRGLIGMKYGQGRGRFDCVTLVRFHLQKHFQLLLGRSQRERTAVDGDKIAARFLHPVARFQFDPPTGRLVALFGSFDEVKAGDVVGIGEPFHGGENGESHWHMGIVASPDNQDFSMIHAAGYYDLRGVGHGRVAEESVVDYMRRIHLSSSWKKRRYTHAFVHRATKVLSPDLSSTIHLQLSEE